MSLEVTDMIKEEIDSAANVFINDLINADNLNDILRAQGKVRVLTTLKDRIDKRESPEKYGLDKDGNPLEGFNETESSRQLSIIKEENGN